MDHQTERPWYVEAFFAGPKGAQRASRIILIAYLEHRSMRTDIYVNVYALERTYIAYFLVHSRAVLS